MAAASSGDLNASKGGASTVLRDLMPLAFANILIPLSAVLTASRLPSLLNLKRGRLCTKIYLNVIESYKYAIVGGT